MGRHSVGYYACCSEFSSEFSRVSFLLFTGGSRLIAVVFDGLLRVLGVLVGLAALANILEKGINKFGDGWLEVSCRNSSPSGVSICTLVLVKSSKVSTWVECPCLEVCLQLLDMHIALVTAVVLFASDVERPSGGEYTRVC